MLQSLKTLNLLGTRVTNLPVEIQNLQKLRHLTVGRFRQVLGPKTFDRVHGVTVCIGIGNLKVLQKLKYIEADNIGIVAEIGELLQLRRLGITKLKKEHGKDLCCSLGKLLELRELTVYSVNDEELINFEYFKPTYCPLLQILNLAGRLDTYPKWISYFSELREIKLRHSKLTYDRLSCLQDLRHLITIYLISAYEGKSLCFKAGGFRTLKNLYLIFLKELRWVTVDENALPFLRRLCIPDCQSMKTIPRGIEHLTLLQDIEFSNMSIEFGNKVEKLDKESATYKRLLQISQVDIARWTGGR